jgi:hypothetical protein
MGSVLNFRPHFDKSVSNDVKQLVNLLRVGFPDVFTGKVLVSESQKVPGMSQNEVNMKFLSVKTPNETRIYQI